MIAFEVKPEASSDAEEDRAKRKSAIVDGLNKYRRDLSNFKFDRDEANDFTISAVSE